MTLQGGEPKVVVGVGRYRLTGNVLGKGNFARVEEAVHTLLNVKVAIKMMDITKIREEYVVRNLYREAKIMSHLSHPCVAALFQTMQNGNLYYLVTELVGGGDLCTFIKQQKTGKLEERLTKVYARQLVSAVSHMHNMGIVHRDLKMENVMLNSIKTRIKIVDFGLSNVYSEDSPLRTHCGSPEYAAPELFVAGKHYGPEVDLWSLGVILYGMVVGQLPFASARDEKIPPQERRKVLLTQINRGVAAPQRKALYSATQDFKTMIYKLLIADPKKRITINELLFNPWVTDKGRKGIRTNPLKKLDEHWRIAIIKEVSTLLNIEYNHVRYAIQHDARGEIAGIFNILVHHHLNRDLEGDGITKPIANVGTNYASPRNKWSIIKKEPINIPKVPENVIKKRPELKSAPVARSPKVSKTPKLSTIAHTPTVSESPSKEAAAKDTVEKRPMFIQFKETTEAVQKRPMSTATARSPGPSPAKLSTERSCLPTRRTLTPTTPITYRPNFSSDLEVTPRCSDLSSTIKNELFVLGTKGISRPINAKLSEGKISERKTSEQKIEKKRSSSDPIQNVRRPQTGPVHTAERALKRRSMLPVTACQSTPHKGQMPEATPLSAPLRNRRVLVKKMAKNTWEPSALAQGDGIKRPTTTPAKKVPARKPFNNEPIARSIAEYVVNNIPSKLQPFKWIRSSKINRESCKI